MNKLVAELQRLYLPDAVQAPGTAPTALPLPDAAGRVRALVIAFRRAGDWDQVSGFWQGVQQDFELPPPAVSVGGGDAAWRVWFSLAEAVPVQQASTFLHTLCQRYLGGILPAQLALQPDAAGTPPSVPMTPALDAATGRWSAFIDPGMGGLFVEEPWLELAPNPDKQAELLARLRSIEAADFQRVLALPVVPAVAPTAPEAVLAGSRPAAPLSGPRHEAGALNAHHDDPRAFLLAVMNDPGVSLALRIEAARALLPGSSSGSSSGA